VPPGKGLWRPGLGSVCPSLTVVPSAVEVAGVEGGFTFSRAPPCPLGSVPPSDLRPGKLPPPSAQCLGRAWGGGAAPCSLTGSFPPQEKDTSLYRPALEELRRQIRSSTTSMTSVPKPLKFLRPHYGKLKEIYENMAPGENKVRGSWLLHPACLGGRCWGRWSQSPPHPVI